MRFFEDVGGVAGIGRCDRMGALGSSRGKAFRFCPEALAFAAYHGFAFKACAPGDAKRKGKCERPFRELKEAFLEELVAAGPPASIGELNRRAQAWLEHEVHARPHRTTGVAPAERLTAEKPLLVPLPRAGFDTARREPRVVGAPVPLVEVDGVAYSAPPALVGGRVEVRLPVEGGIVEIRVHGRPVATHAIAPAGSPPVWDAIHRREAEAIALAPHRRRHLVAVPDPEIVSRRLDLGGGDYDVDEPDLSRYDVEVFGPGCGCGGGL